MKKLLLSLSLIGILGGFLSIASANTTSCKTVNFSNGSTACVNITTAGTNRRSLTTTLNGGSTYNMRCDILTPDGQLKSIPGCNGEFNYNKQNGGYTIKLWIRNNEVAPINREGKPNNYNNSVYPERQYDFNNGSRFSDNYNGNGNNNGDLNNFLVTADDTTPSTNQYVDLTVKARDNNNYTLTDYTDSINFKVYYRASNSSYWNETTSSTYYTMSSTYRYGYDFTSSNYGVKTLTNFIKFNRNNYDYKVRVYDENDTSIYNEIIFNVGSSNSNIYGFTSSELNTVQSIYNARDDMIYELKNTYPALNNSNTRKTMSNNFKVAMQEIINNASNKTYTNYNEFYTAWLARYRYTIAIR